MNSKKIIVGALVIIFAIYLNVCINSNDEKNPVKYPPKPTISTTTSSSIVKEDNEKLVVEGTIQSFEVYVEHNMTKVICDTGTYYLKTILSMSRSKNRFWINENEKGRWFCIEEHQYCWKVDGM